IDSQHHTHVPFLLPQNRFITNITLKNSLDQTIKVSRFYSPQRFPTFNARPCRSFIRISWKGSSNMWRMTIKKLLAECLRWILYHFKGIHAFRSRLTPTLYLHRPIMRVLIAYPRTIYKEPT